MAGAWAAGMNVLLFDHQRRAPKADSPRVETFDALIAYLDALPAPAAALSGAGKPQETHGKPADL